MVGYRNRPTKATAALWLLVVCAVVAGAGLTVLLYSVAGLAAVGLALMGRRIVARPAQGPLPARISARRPGRPA